MAESYWSNPRDALFKPLPGFVVGGAYRGAAPGYSGATPAKLPKTTAVQSPAEWATLPYPVVGTDFGTGKRDVDLNQTTPAIPDTSNIFDQILKFKQASYPIERQQQEESASLNARLAQEQMLASYPILSAAAQEARLENVAASIASRKGFADIEEGRPSFMQQQMLTGALADQARLNALSTALATAKQMSFSGKNISYSA